MRYLAGIDLGTSSVKVLIMDTEGNSLAVTHAEYDVMTPKMLYAEQNPDQWWKCTVAAIQEAMQKSGIDREELAGIGLSGQMHGLVALDREYRLVGPAIIWMDQRSAEETAQIRQLARELSDQELLNQPGAGMMICTLLWLKHHQPDVYEKIQYVMLPKDYIRYRLTGEIGSELSDASATLAFSVKNLCWCKELIKRVGLKEDVWPALGKSTEVAGYVSEAAARETGLSVRTKVVYGGSDSSAQLVGNGIIKEGTMSCNIGTASQVAVVVNAPMYDKEMRLQTWCHAVPKTWYVQAGTLNGGSTLRWLKKNILEDQKAYSILDAEAGKIPVGSEGLLYLPYMAGERTPMQDPMAKGVYFGMSLKHRQAHLVRAIMEGVVYNLKECTNILDQMGIHRDRMISSGGAAKGVTWKQIQADIMDMPVYTTKTEEEACQGAALLAGVGCGIYQNIQEACEIVVKINDMVIDPIAENVSYYQEQLEVFRELYSKVKDLYPKLKMGPREIS